MLHTRIPDASLEFAKMGRRATTWSTKNTKKTSSGALEYYFHQKEIISLVTSLANCLPTLDQKCHCLGPKVTAPKFPYLHYQTSSIFLECQKFSVVKKFWNSERIKIFENKMRLIFTFSAFGLSEGVSSKSSGSSGLQSSLGHGKSQKWKFFGTKYHKMDKRSKE